MFPPGPRSKLPLAGLALRRDPLEYLSSLAARYGDIVHFRVGTQDFFLLNHPDHIRDVLVTNHNNFARRIFLQRAKRMLGEGLLTSEGEHYKRHRQLIQPEFHRQRIAKHARMIVASGEEFIAHWKEDEKRDVLADMRSLSLAATYGTLFGGDVEWGGCRISEQLTTAIQELYLFNGRQSWKTLVSRKLGLVDPNRFQNACKKLDEAIYRLLSERRERGIEKGDILSILMSGRYEAESLSDTEVRDEVATLIEAGHITLASVLTWVWLLLAANSAAEEKLHAEVDEALRGRLPVFEDLPRLPYTNMVLLEAMRLYSPVWVMSRRALHDYEVGGYTLPAGSILLMSQHVMHRDKRYWAQPERFDPERWSLETNDRPQFSYFPFGGGPRRCIGEGLSMLEGVLLLATMASKWRLRSLTGRLPKPVGLVSVVVPKATLMKLEGR